MNYPNRSDSSDPINGRVGRIVWSWRLVEDPETNTDTVQPSMVALCVGAAWMEGNSYT